MPRTRTSTEWTETASATNGTATATHAASSGDTHFVTTIVAGFTGSGNAADLTLSDGDTTILTITVHDDITLELPYPIKLTTGNRAEATLGAGGSSVDGNVTIGGFTRPAS